MKHKKNIIFYYIDFLYFVLLLLLLLLYITIFESHALNFRRSPTTIQDIFLCLQVTISWVWVVLTSKRDLKVDCHFHGSFIVTSTFSPANHSFLKPQLSLPFSLRFQAIPNIHPTLFSHPSQNLS